jgi:tetratricopeptide (TPR) repeat protein
MSTTSQLSAVPLLLAQARTNHQTGNLLEAERLYLQILQTQPDQFDARHFLGILRDQQGRHVEALELIAAALEIKPSAIPALWNYAIVLRKLKRHEEALASYEKMLAINPHDADALYNRAQVFRSLKRNEEALASFDQALTLRPKYAEALCNRAHALTALGHYKEALASYDKALTIKPDYFSALHNRANLLESLTRYEEALASYDKALAARPEHAEALNSRGNVLSKLKRYEEALASYNKALAIKPNYAEAHHGRGTALDHLGLSDEAIGSYDRALEIRGISISEQSADAARDIGSQMSWRAENTNFIIEWRPLAALSTIVAEWSELVGCALEPNIFYEPAFALAAANIYGSRVGAALVWSQASPQRLVGLFPSRIERIDDRLILVGWRHPQIALGTPLIHRDFADGVVEAFLDYVYRTPQLPKLMIFPFIRELGPYASVLNRVLLRRGDRGVMFDRHHRGQLAPGSERASYLDRSIGSKKRKNNLRRARRQLEETGRVAFATATTQTEIATALYDFFALEASGWKGRAKTAAAAHPEERQIFETAVLGFAAEGKVRVDRLLLEDRAIAASITFKSGNDAWFWKTAYDENFAQASPGVQLMLDLTKALLADLTITQVDGCAQRDNPLINHIWRERLSIIHSVISAGPETNVDFELACRDIALRFAERR